MFNCWFVAQRVTNPILGTHRANLLIWGVRGSQVSSPSTAAQLSARCLYLQHRRVKMRTDRQVTARERGWHITGCKAIKTVYKQTWSWVWLNTVTGLVWGCSDTVRALWVPVLGNRGSTGIVRVRMGTGGAAEPTKLLSPQIPPKLQR